MHNMRSIKSLLIVLVISSILPSCKKYLDTGAPEGQLVTSSVFTTDASATAAVLALYSTFNTSSILLMNTTLAGMSADDVQYNASNTIWDEFRSNAISIGSSGVQNYWSSAYAIIYAANSAIEGISASNGLTAATQQQLLGEVKFWRAFVYFHLYNLYGPVPLVTSTDLATNTTLGRSDSSAIYQQVITDLTDAQKLLTTTYPSTFKARVNLYAATAFLARVYLYAKDYANAETQATAVIGSGMYTLGADLGKVFKNTSGETIWQISSINGYSIVGSAFVPGNASTLPSYILYDTIYNSMDNADSRKSSWATAALVSGTTYHYATKYKLTSAATGGDEYTVMLRLAELYLVRAEARAQLNSTAGATSDVDSIRIRAGLPVLGTGLSKEALLQEVMLQRKLELFGEGGHRWFDLKRTGTAISELSYLKPNLASKPGHLLFPIPANERTKNINLSQNTDY
jgi:hypothetical protein